VLVLLQSVTEASEECRQALLKLVPLETPVEAEAGGAEGAVEEQNAAMQLTSDYVDDSFNGWVIKELLALTENSPSPNVKWFAARYTTRHAHDTHTTRTRTRTRIRN
jgi:hypothetical protein